MKPKSDFRGNVLSSFRVFPRTLRIALSALLAIAGALTAASPAKAQITVSKVLHGFSTGNDGSSPQNGTLLRDGAGNLFGTTVGGGPSGEGVVFELVNSGGTYTEKVLYSFTGSPDGANPYGSLIMDSAGNFYGTTQSGGSNNVGAVFELVNSAGTYTEKVLYSFQQYYTGDGAYPVGGLVMDSAGNLYGTTYYGGHSLYYGTIFELANSGGGNYTESVLYSFNGSDGNSPYGESLILDSHGNLYGTTRFGGSSSNGTVFELVNSSGSFSLTTLYSFQGGVNDGANPYSGVIYGLVREPVRDNYIRRQP